MIVAIAVIAVVLKLAVKNQTINPLPPAPEIIPSVATLTYRNTVYGFAFNYPEGSDVRNEYFEGYLPSTQTGAVGIFIPKSLAHGTNLGEAGVFVGVSPSREALQKCGGATNAGETARGTIMINGEIFNAFDASDAGAGNFYESKIYRTVHSGSCYEIVELLHTTNIGNYDPGTVQVFDKAKFSGYLDLMAKSFTFTAVSGSGVIGTVALGPTCPVERMPPDPNCAPRPYQTTIQIYYAGSTTLLKSVSTDFNGRFRTELAPGNYALEAKGGQTLPRCSVFSVTVKQNSFSESDIQCDTGIR